MTRNLGIELPENIRSLLSCCQRVISDFGWSEATLEFENLPPEVSVSSPREFLEHITRVARKSGIRTTILRPQPEQLAVLASRLPAVVEFKNGSYGLLRGMEVTGAGQSQIHISRSLGMDWRDEALGGEEFFRVWAGGMLVFERINTGLVCFSLVAREHKIEITEQRLQHEFNLSHRELDARRLLRMAREQGLRARELTLRWDDLQNLQKSWPAIAVTGGGRHLVLTGLVRGNNTEKEEKLACYDPLEGNSGGHLLLSREEFEKIWSGKVFVFKRKYRLTDQNQPFGLRWFLPEILRQKLTFVDIGLAVLFINLISLVTPIFFQIVIDKVLVNQAFTTLQVLGIGMTAALLVNAGLDFLRDYLLLHATNKIDLRVTGRTFSHLLQLPLGFFEHAAAGVLT